MATAKKKAPTKRATTAAKKAPAKAAVKKARRFDVPEDSALFERYFRRFTLLFKPEDLLR